MMDLMYGCGSDYDYSEEELPEVDLKAEHDRIIAVTTGKAIDLMAELATSPLFDSDEYDELEIRFDSSPRFDPYTIGSIGISSHKSPAKNHSSNNNNNISTTINGNNHTTKFITKTNHHQHHHNSSSTTASSIHLKSNSSITANNTNHIHLNTTSSSGIIKSQTQMQQLRNQKFNSVTNGKSVSVNSMNHKSNNNTSNFIVTSTTTTSNNNNSSNNSSANNNNNNNKPTTIVATIGSLSLGGLAALEDTCGALVEPASVVPVSVSSSLSSQGSGSDGEYQELPTDEEESECEFTNNPSNTVWVLPRQPLSSRSPSPNDIPEFEFDEPEFIITTGATIQEIPPPKKRKQKHEPQPHTDGKIYPKPAFSYSCLIAMSLKNSKTGSLPVSEIYKFMCDHFPYFKSAPSGWKNSVRHNLSLNKCFEKIEKPGNGARKGCLWALNPSKVHKMDEEVLKWSRKDPLAIRRAMSDPENLEMIEKGELKRDYSGNGASDEDDEEDISEPCTPLSQAQLLARRSRVNSDSLPGETTTISSTTPTTTISLNRPMEQKIHVKSEPMDTIDFTNHHTITNVRAFGGFECHSGTTGYTLSFSALNNASTPIIIRRTPVK